MTWPIRLARPADKAGLEACAHAAFAVYLPRMTRAPAPMAADLSGPIDRGEVCVALGPDRATLGFVLCRAERQDMLLDTLAVWPAHKGQGVGTALVAHVEALARAQGLHAVMLCTNAAMTENQRFYPALGYLRTGRAMQDGFDRVFYRKVLD